MKLISKLNSTFVSKSTLVSPLILAAALVILPCSSFAQICSSVGLSQPSAVQDHVNLQATTRVQVTCSLRDAFIKKYSLLDLKKKRIGLDIPHHLENCALAESLIPTSNLNDFEDRLLECLAPLKDSHISMLAQTPRPYVTVGLSLRKVGSQFVVAGYDSKILQISSKGLPEALFAPGVVVETIDGQHPEMLMKRLAQFVIASSEDFVNFEATKSLTTRDFSYPSRSQLELKLSSSANPATLDWVIHPVVLREDLRNILFDGLKLKSTPGQGLDRKRPVDGFGLDYIGYDERKPLVPDSEKVLWATGGSPAIRRGKFVTASAGEACYIQILNSVDQEVRTKENPNQRLDRRSEIAKFLSACKNAGQSLVLDLRRNPGGNFNVPISDFSVMIPAAQEYPSAFTTGRFTAHLRQAFDVFNLGPEFPLNDWSAFSQDRFYRSVTQAQEQGLPYISAISEKNVGTPSGVSSYDLPIVVLTSSQCISGCELMVSLLQNRPNTLLVGTPTNGTSGMPFHFTFSPINSGWRDDHFGTISVRLPNAIYGVLKAPVKSGPRPSR